MAMVTSFKSLSVGVLFCRRSKITFLLSKVLVCILIAMSCYASEKLLLEIPARVQWNFGGGYCAETAIQMSGIYYGQYVSQDTVRRTVENNEIGMGTLLNRALDSLSFTYNPTVWKTDIKQYFFMLKQNLNKGIPIIVATCHGSERWSHIISAIGYYSLNSISEYNDNDSLFYNEDHLNYTSVQSFKTWQDTKVHNYFDPKEQYGTIILGIKDPDKETLPVRLVVDHFDEPLPTSPPVKINMKIKIKSLVVGKPYLLLKYINWRKVPIRNFAKDTNCIFKKFVATLDTAEFSDSFMNTNTAIFRCVPDKVTGIHTSPSDEVAVNQMHLKQLTSKNFILSIPKDSYVDVMVFNCKGKIVSSPIVNRYMSKGDHTISMGGSSFTDGTYYVQMSTNNHKKVQKIVILK